MPEIGLLLPCNIVLQGHDAGVTVSFVNAKAMFTIVDDHPDLDGVAEDADERLARVRTSLGG